WHNYLDQTNGASISTRAMLAGLTERNWNLQTLCGPAFDSLSQSLEECFSKNRQIRFLFEKKSGGSDYPYSMLSFRDGSIDSVAFKPLPKSPSQQAFNRRYADEFLSLYKAYLATQKPDLVITYGGAFVRDQILRWARCCGCKTCATIHNYAYNDPFYFRYADLVIVPSFHCQRYYEEVGVRTIVIPPVIDLSPFRKLSPFSFAKRKFLLFINPTTNKGVYWFAGLAKELWKIRPDIPILVVEGSAGIDALANPTLGLNCVNNINFVRNTPFPQIFYDIARVILIPSLFNESFCRVAAEAMASGVPIIASNRGAIPETVQDAGILLDIPSKYTPISKIVPSPEELQSWIEAILHFWDDEAFCQKFVDLGKRRAYSLWNNDFIIDRYDQQFRELIR
ncbi:MAG: glycosyltransferase family 4 protein, partial [Thermoguttaceae bacterium]